MSDTPANLPKRQKYTIGYLKLDVQAQDHIADGVRTVIVLPDPPARELDEMDLVDYIKSLRDCARKALAELNRSELNTAIPEDQLASGLRVSITVIDQGARSIGTVFGNGLTYGPRGNVLTQARSQQ